MTRTTNTCGHLMLKALPCSVLIYDSSLIGVQPEKKLFWKLVKSLFFFLRKLTVVLSSISSSSSSASSGKLGFLTSFRSDVVWPMSPISLSTYSSTQKKKKRENVRTNILFITFKWTSQIFQYQCSHLVTMRIPVETKGDTQRHHPVATHANLFSSSLCLQACSGFFLFLVFCCFPWQFAFITTNPVSRLQPLSNQRILIGHVYWHVETLQIGAFQDGDLQDFTHCKFIPPGWSLPAGLPS